MKKYLVIICLMVGLTASAQNGEVFSVLKLEPQASAPTNAFWTNGSLYRHTDGTIYHKVGGSWVALGGTTTEIVNNLTSTDTDKALSAAQGKVLQDGKLNKPTTTGATSRGSLVTYTGSTSYYNTEITIGNSGDLLRMGKVDMSGNGFYIKSLDNLKSLYIGNLKGYSSSPKDSTMVALYPKDEYSSDWFGFDYEDDRWEIEDSPIITAANAASNGIGGTDDQTAAEVPITDSGLYFLGNDVEAALQELGLLTIGNTSFIKRNVRIATTANITLSGLQSIDGNMTSEGERVLVKNQSTASQNGIYIASSGSWSRAPEASSAAKLARTYVYVTSGGTMYDKFFQTDFNVSDTLGSDDVIFTETPFNLSGGTPADGSISTAKLADAAVTSTKILDGTILNADINAAAGIEGTKIAITPFGDISSTNAQTVVEEIVSELGSAISSNTTSIGDNTTAITALQTVPASSFVTDTKTGNYTFVADDAKDNKIIYLDYDNETATIPADVFTVGNTIRIKNGTSGLANIVAGASVTFPTVTLYKPNQSITIKMASTNVWQVEDGVSLSEVKWIPMVLSAVDWDLTVGTNKAVFHIPFAARVVGVKAGVATAGTGSTITIDINEAGTSILSTKLTIDASETHTSTAATAAVISDVNLAADARITADIDQIGSSTAGKGAIAYLGVIQL